MTLVLGNGDGTFHAPAALAVPMNSLPPPDPDGVQAGLMTATLSNTGTATLAITSISVVGTDSGDFPETNTCGSSVAAGTSCTISVTFAPSATGAAGTLTASVNISDNAAGSPQTITLTGTGVAPFSLGPTGSTSATITAGQTAKFNLQITPTGDFAGNVALSYSGAPATTTCAVSQSLVVLPPAQNVLFTVNVTTTVRGMTPLSDRLRQHPIAWIAVGALNLFVLLVGTLWTRQGLGRDGLAPAAALGMLLALAACGGGSGGSKSPSPPASTGTPAGTFKVTVTASASGVSQSTQLTVNVE